MKDHPAPQATYYAPTGGLPPQTALHTGRAVFTEAYAVIPKGVYSDIVTSFLPHWDKTRAWIIARPLSGFAETFSQYIMEVSPGGGSTDPEPDPAAEGVLFVVEGGATLTVAGAAPTPSRPAATPTSRRRPPGSSATTARPRSASTGSASPTSPPRASPPPTPSSSTNVTSRPPPCPIRRAAGPRPASSTPPTSAHDMHVTVVTFEPGGLIPFEETHVMEHGLYVLEGKAAYRLNRDWVEVEAGDFMWLRAFCPQACYAGGPDRFRYLLYKDVNRHATLRRHF